MANYNTEFMQAPAEAEAELALMNSLGLIDAVISDDSDAAALLCK